MWLRLKKWVLAYLDRFVRKRATFFPIEINMIDAVRAALPPEQENLLRLQVAQINLVQRSPFEREVCLYHSTFSRFGFDPATEFTNKEDEILLAAVKLSRPHDEKKLKVEFWVVGGHLFQIVYSQPLEKFYATTQLDRIEAEIVDVKIFADPQVDRWANARRKPIAQDAIQSIGKLLKTSNVSNLVEPYESEIVARELDRFNTDFPATYIELLKYCDGCQVGECKVIGIRATWRVETENGSFQILAERASLGLIAAKVVAVDCEIYFIDVVDDEIKKLGKDFAKALQWLNDRPL
jgi:hypothetical protein